MPPSRRRPPPNPGQVPPVRRPKVAGLRHRPATQPTDKTADQTERPVEPEEPVEREPASGTLDAEPEPEPEPVAEAEAGTGSLPKVDLGTDEPPDEPHAGEPERETAGQTPRTQRPAGKRRATGATRPADLTAAEAGTRSQRAGRVAARPRGPRNPYSVAAILVVMAVILAGLAVWFRGEASALESRDSNTALTDSAATSEVLGQLTTAVETTLSYNYTDLESTKKAVENVLAGSARCEYDKLFGQLLELAPKQKLILATAVRDIALVRLDGDRAEALVFIDLVSTRVDTNKSAPGDAVFGVYGRREGDQWKITGFNMFDQPLVDGQPAPKC